METTQILDLLSRPTLELLILIVAWFIKVELKRRNRRLEIIEDRFQKIDIRDEEKHKEFWKEIDAVKNRITWIEAKQNGRHKHEND